MKNSLSSVWIRGAAVAAAALLAWAAAGAGPHDPKDWPVPEAAKKRPNPVPPGEATIRAARPFYAEKCASCHGDKGKGDGPEAIMYAVKPADLSDAHMMSEMSDGELFYKITEGRQPMPAFKRQLTEQQRWQLVHYLRTFAKQPAAPAKKAPPQKH